MGVDFYNAIQIVTIIALGARFSWLWFLSLQGAVWGVEAHWT